MEILAGFNLIGGTWILIRRSPINLTFSELQLFKFIIMHSSFKYVRCIIYVLNQSNLIKSKKLIKSIFRFKSKFNKGRPTQPSAKSKLENSGVAGLL